MREQHLLHLARIDVRAAADDEILRAIDQRQEALRVERADVAGMEPAVGERRGAGVGIHPVPAHDGRSAHQDFAGRPRRERMIVGIGDDHVDAGLRDTHRADPGVVAARDRVGEERAIHGGDRHRRFALAVDLREARAQRRERRLAVGDVHRPAAVDDRLQPLQRRGGKRRRRDESLHHRRRREQAAPVPVRRETQRLRGVEALGFRQHVHRACEHMRHRVQPRPMRERRRVHDRISRQDRLDVGQEALAHRQQVAVRDHHTLRPPGRAARIEKPRRIVGAAHRRRARRRFGHARVFDAAELDRVLDSRCVSGRLRPAWRATRRRRTRRACRCGRGCRRARSDAASR